jgi:acetoacetyl-CoA synthetase
MTTADAPKILWQPDDTMRNHAHLTHYFEWLRQHPKYVLDFKNYADAWQWSTTHVEDFWESLWLYFKVESTTPYRSILSGKMPNAHWFEGAELNYVAHIFRQYSDERPAILYQSETHVLREMSWRELRQQVAALSTHFRDLGVRAGDSVVGFLPNIPQATVAFLATISIGAVWSSASPDFGASSVLERFGQIEPKVLIAVEGYHYGGKYFDKLLEIKRLQDDLPTLLQTILISNIAENFHDLSKSATWQSVTTDLSAVLQFVNVPFAHPMWVLYSSGTTGAPKAIVHSHGGMLLEHLKYVHFHADIHEGERFFWFTTTGWMMWNFVQAALLAGATIVLYDGSPAFPRMDTLWRLVEKAEVNHFGTSAAFILSCMKLQVAPKNFDLSALRGIGSTGSPLPKEGFDWIYTAVKSDVWLTSMSGGTDVCTAFVGGNPLLEVYEGEIQCRALGCAMQSWDENGQPLNDEVGEMVVTQPMPCMPIYFHNDPTGEKYRNSYFDTYEGIWRHGDWLRITPRGSLVILGRSDATLNRQGIRIGTSEIYRSVEQLPFVRDSLIVNIEQANGESFMPLFVVLRDELTMNEEYKKLIRKQLRQDYSPRHVPDAIIAVPDIPYTISGKKLELPVKKILNGVAIEKAVNIGSVRNAASLAFFFNLDFVGHS